MHSYKQAGVDIERGERIVRFLKGLQSPALGKGIGAFAAGLELDTTGYRHPVILAGCDGVGTKLLVARELRCYDTVGIDLVAMCVNDLLASGARALMFQDYIACGRIDETVLQPVLGGIVRGCELAECTLTGGETAEMPDMYDDADLDLAGFAVGLAERDALLPRTEAMAAGDLLVGLPSSGIHSNGLSLARKVLATSDWADLLIPTRIYAGEMRALLATGAVLGASHITGGGLTGNVPRMLPEHLGPELRYDWPVPELFERIRSSGGVAAGEMRRVFNMGLGMVLVVRATGLDSVRNAAAQGGFSVLEVGRLVERG